MKFTRSLFAGAALVASMSANVGAQVTATLSGPLIGGFYSLSGPGACTVGMPCTLSNMFGNIGNFVGGTTYDGDQPFADIPAGTVFGPRFIAAGAVSGQPSTLTFTAPVTALSFLWGSPDVFNIVTVRTNTGTPQAFTPQGLSFVKTNGDQTFSQYVTFTASGSTRITSIEFSNTQLTNAMEAANFSATVLPEPSTYALMAGGLAALAFASRRRKRIS